MEFPANLRYSADHLWVKPMGGGRVTVGLTDHAQHELGKIIYLDLPGVGDSLAAGEEMGTVESQKTVSDLVAPVSGEVVKINDGLLDDPEPVNDDPYRAGWLLRVELEGPLEEEDLMGADEYRDHVGGEE